MDSQSSNYSAVAAPLVEKSTFIIVIWCGTAIATLSLAFRYYIRIKCFHCLLVDDYVTGFAWVLLVATAILWQVIVNGLYEITRVGAGLQLPSANFVANSEKYLKGSLSVLFMFYVGLWTIKMNFILFFYKLGSHIAAYRIYWWSVTIFTIAAGFVCIGTIQYHCLADSFDKISAHCTGASAIRYQSITLKLNCGLDVFTDALIVSMPISILWNVHISLARKSALAGIFSLVIITMIVAILRVTVTTGKGAVSQQKQVEMTWLYLWHFIESSVALLVACLASFRALFVQQNGKSEADARKQELAERSTPGPKFISLRSRARRLHDSLFDSIKSSDGTQHQIVSDDMAFPLRDKENGIHDIFETDHHHRSLDTLPKVDYNTLSAV